MFLKKPLIWCLMLLGIYANLQAQQSKAIKAPVVQAKSSSNKIHSCGTPPMTAEQRRYTLEVIDQTGAERNAGLTAIPIRVHIVNKDAGTDGISLGDVNIGISYLNYFYKEVGAEFYIANVNYINSTALWDFETDEEAAMTSTHSVYDAINIYFVDTIEITSSGSYACGYARYPSNNVVTMDVLMRNDCTASYENGTLVHELGHFLNLQHTHDGTEDGNADSDAENVARTGVNANCTTNGDMLCDTEADPNGSNDGSCNFVNDGTSTQDIHGVTYTPDLDNIMSYYSDFCGGIFTTEQYTRMTNALATRQGHSAYTMDASPATVTDPSGLTATLNNSYGIDLNWTDNAGNETGYLIERSSDGGTTWLAVSGGGVDANVTTFTDETFSSNATYDYRVKASNDDVNDYATAAASVVVGNVYCIPSALSNSCTYGGGGTFGFAVYSFLLEETSGTDLIDNDYNGCDGPLSVFTGTHTAAVTAGTTYNFEVDFLENPSAGSYYQQYVTIWVDTNLDGDFEDAGETLYQAGAASTSPTVTGSITIPATAVNGNATLRVRTGWDGGGVVSDPCNYHAASEAEDYGLTISGGLPVELINFTGKKMEEKVQLNWSTASEEDNDYFIIERSSNGKDFEFLARENGKGTSNDFVSYELLDNRPLSGMNYYRLVQVDFDGTKHIQDRTVAIEFEETGTVSIFPNPTRGDIIHLNYFAPSSGDFKIAVYGLDGSLKYEEQYEAQKGGNQYNIDLPQWSAGIYLIKVYREEEVQTIRFVKGT